MHLRFIEPAGSWQKLFPLTYTRPIADLRVGILKIQEKWCRHLEANSHAYRTEGYLSALFSDTLEADLEINGALIPTPDLVRSIRSLKEDQGLYMGPVFLGGNQDGQAVQYSGEVSLVNYPWDIFRLTRQEIQRDFNLLTDGRNSEAISDPHTRTYGNQIFLEEGVSLKACVLNSETGPIYLGRNSEIQEGAVIRGSFALGEHSVVNMGANMRGDTSVGPHSKVGGEVSNSSIQGYSNKAHDGFLGNSVLGEWCNLGADTNNSNLKNNYTNVKMWDFESARFKDTGLQFCGLIMGDHSKCGINVMFNTGTTVGVSANIFGSGFPRTIIPSFAWGGAGGFSTYQIGKALETARLVVGRRGLQLTGVQEDILTKVFNQTAENRIWEK